MYTTQQEAAARLARLIQLGEHLHGPRWRAPLARDIGVGRRTLGYWLTGRSSVPPSAICAAEDVLAARVEADRQRLERLLAPLLTA